MNTNEMLVQINNEIGRPIVKNGGKKILANPFKFIREADDFVIYRNVERIGMTEIFRSRDENAACERFLKELKRL